MDQEIKDKERNTRIFKMFSLICIIEKICLIFSLINLFQESRNVFFSLLLILLLINIVACIFCSQRSDVNLLFELLNYMYYPKYERGQLLNLPNMYGVNTIIYFCESSLLNLIILLNPDKDYFIIQACQILSSMIFCFLYEINTYQKRQITACTKDALERHVIQQLVQRYYILCHHATVFYLYDIIIIVFVVSVQFSEKLKRAVLINRSTRKFVLITEVMCFKLYNLFFQNFGFFINIDDLQKNMLFRKDGEEQEFLMASLQSFQILIMFLFDLFFNQNFENKTSQTILTTYLIFSLPCLIKSIKWYLNFLLYGPFSFSFNIDCKQTRLLSLEQIRKEVFDINNNQLLVTIILQNVDFDELHRIISILYDQYNVSIVVKQKQQSVFIDKQDKNVEITFNTYSFINMILFLLVQKQLYSYSYRFKFVNPSSFYKYKDLTLAVINNYQILPALEYSYIKRNLSTFYAELIKCQAFYSNITNQLNFSPQQTYYDLYAG